MSTEAALMASTIGVTYDEVMEACRPDRTRRRIEIELWPRTFVIYAQLAFDRWIAIHAERDTVSARRWVTLVRYLTVFEQATIVGGDDV
jgi:hypothetical protein